MSTPYVGMTRDKIKKLSKDPKEVDLILKGMQLALDICNEHADAWCRVGETDKATVVDAVGQEIKDSMFKV